MQEPFVIERTYNASVATVWKAITDREQMKKWYFDIREFKAEVGFEFEFAGQGSKGEHYLHLCRITDVEPEKKLRYSWRNKDLDGLSFVTFELFPEGNNTRLKLTHEGLGSFPVHPDFERSSFAAGWTALIGKNLKDFVEKG